LVLLLCLASTALGAESGRKGNGIDDMLRCDKKLCSERNIIGITTSSLHGLDVAVLKLNHPENFFQAGIQCQSISKMKSENFRNLKALNSAWLLGEGDLEQFLQIAPRLPSHASREREKGNAVWTGHIYMPPMSVLESVARVEKASYGAKLIIPEGWNNTGDDSGDDSDDDSGDNRTNILISSLLGKRGIDASVPEAATLDDRADRAERTKLGDHGRIIPMDGVRAIVDLEDGRLGMVYAKAVAKRAAQYPFKSLRDLRCVVAYHDRLDTLPCFEHLNYVGCGARHDWWLNGNGGSSSNSGSGSGSGSSSNTGSGSSGDTGGKGSGPKSG